MQIKESRTKKFAYLIIILFSINFILGSFGSLFEERSIFQILFWHISTTSMIAACVLMGAYVAEKGWSFASGGFYLLGVANGVFFASLNIDAIYPLVLARGVLILIPAFIAIGMSNYFSTLLKWLSISICLPFIILYFRILSGSFIFNDRFQVMSFFYLGFVGMLWAINIWRELHRDVEASV